MPEAAQREALACAIAQENYMTDDVEVSTPDDNRGVLAVESCDSGYWVSARIWVTDAEVEERMDHADSRSDQDAQPSA